MGNCESCNKPKNYYPNNSQIQIANQSKMDEINTYLNKKENKTIIEQDAIAGKVLPISSGKEEEINNQMKNSICKIYANEKYGTAFLCKIPFPDEFSFLPVLIANKSLINEDYLLTKSLIEISMIQGIIFLDHLIISNNNYYSFYKESNLFNK